MSSTTGKSYSDSLNQRRHTLLTSRLGSQTLAEVTEMVAGWTATLPSDRKKTFIDRAKCRGVGHEEFFPPSEWVDGDKRDHVTQLRDFYKDANDKWCRTCPVKAECLADTLLSEGQRDNRFGFRVLIPSDRWLLSGLLELSETDDVFDPMEAA